MPAPGVVDLSQYRKNPEEVLNIPPESTPYEFGQMFNFEGMGNKSLAKKKLRQLVVLDPVIRSMLHPGERVYYLTDGIKCNTAEQMFIGWIVYYYNHNAFVFTSERILLIHLTGKRKLGKFVGVIQYGDMVKVKSSFTGSLSIKFRNGKSIVFGRVAGKDRKFIKEYLAPIVKANPADKDKKAPTIIDLCPSCYAEVHDKNASQCSNCQTEFRTPTQAAIRSLFWPGLGDTYLGSSVLGPMEMAGIAFFWLSFAMGAVDIAEHGNQDEMMSYIIGVLFFIFVVHGLDALKTYYVGCKGVFPKRNIKRIRQERGYV